MAWPVDCRWFAWICKAWRWGNCEGSHTLKLSKSLSLWSWRIIHPCIQIQRFSITLSEWKGQVRQMTERFAGGGGKVTTRGPTGEMLTKPLTELPKARIIVSIFFTSNPFTGHRRYRCGLDRGTSNWGGTNSGHSHECFERHDQVRTSADTYNAGGPLPGGGHNRNSSKWRCFWVADIPMSLTHLEFASVFEARSLQYGRPWRQSAKCQSIAIALSSATSPSKAKHAENGWTLQKA